MAQQRSLELAQLRRQILQTLQTLEASKISFSL